MHGCVTRTGREDEEEEEEKAFQALHWVLYP